MRSSLNLNFIVTIVYRLKHKSPKTSILNARRIMVETSWTFSSADRQDCFGGSCDRDCELIGAETRKSTKSYDVIIWPPCSVSICSTCVAKPDFISDNVINCVVIIWKLNFKINFWKIRISDFFLSPLPLISRKFCCFVTSSVSNKGDNFFWIQSAHAQFDVVVFVVVSMVFSQQKWSSW